MKQLLSCLILLAVHSALHAQDSSAMKTQQLQGVQVKANKPVFSQHDGNLKMDVSNPVLQASTSAINLLSKMPGVQLSSDQQSVNLIGKGAPLIYLENQRISLNDLQSIPVHEIKTIEIIQNPGAKYEADGRVVILVTRKFSTRDGVRIDVAENAAQRRYFRNQASMEMDVKKKQLEVKANVAFNDLTQWESNSNRFIVKEDDIQSGYHLVSRGLREQWLLGGGVHYQFDEHSYVSVTGNGRIDHNTYDIKTPSDLVDNGTITQAQSLTDNALSRPYSNWSLNYAKQFANGLELFVGGQYGHYSQHMTGDIFNGYNGDAMKLDQQRNQVFGLNTGTGRIDLGKKFSEHFRADVGVNYATSSSHALLETYAADSSYQRSFYHYQERIGAVYGQVTAGMGKTTLDAGLRLENATAFGQFDTAATATVDRHNLQLLPRVSWKIPLDTSKTLTLAFARSLARPGYASLSQFVTYINPFFQWASNASLLPTLTSEVNASLQFGKNSVQLNVYSRRHPVYYNASYDAGAKRFQVIDDNFDKEQGVNATVTMPFTVHGWTSTNSVTGMINKVTDSNSTDLKVRPFVYVYSGNQVTLPDSFSVFANCWATTASYEGVFHHNAMTQLDVGVSKSFNNRLVITLTANDIFRSVNYRDQLDTAGVTSGTLYYDDNRELALNVRYTLGGISNALFRNKEVNNNSNRLP